MEIKLPQMVVDKYGYLRDEFGAHWFCVYKIRWIVAPEEIKVGTKISIVAWDNGEYSGGIPVRVLRDGSLELFVDDGMDLVDGLDMTSRLYGFICESGLRGWRGWFKIDILD